MIKKLGLSASLIFGIFSGFFLLFTPGGGRAEEKTRSQYLLKWATIAPENSVWGDAVVLTTKEIEKRSRGRLKNIWYFGAVMGDEPETILKLKQNELQELALLSVGLSKISPELLAFSIPFLFKNYQEVDCVFNRAWPLVEKVMAEKGYVVFGRADVGFSVIFSKKELRTAEDFKNAKMWTWAGLEIDKPAADLLGVKTQFPLPLPEVLPALQNGMVDTVYATYYTVIALQWNTQIRYMTDIEKYRGAYAPGLLILKKATFDALPPEIQKAMKEVWGSYFPLLRKHLREDEENARQGLLKRGIKYMEIDPKFLKDINIRAQSIFKYKDLGSSPWFLNSVLDARDRCRAELAK